MASKFRCPYCGYVFEGRLNYCPNCHKKLNYVNKTSNNSSKPPKKGKGGKIFAGIFIPSVVVAGVIVAVAFAVSHKSTEQPKAKYQVTWVNDNGDVLETDNNVIEGSTPSYDGTTPTKEGNEQYTYTFIGWEPEITTVSGDVIYTAKYSSSVNKYTITWVVDGVETTEQYDYGDMPHYNGTTYKESDVQYTYTFTGWDKTITSVTGNETYTAVFASSLNEYTISFIDGDGNLLEAHNLHYGESIIYEGEEPTKTSDAQYSYHFIGWDASNTTVIGNQVFTAQFESILNYYDITWVINGNSYVESYPYGASPSYTGDVIKEQDAQYTYSFSHWSPEVELVTGNKTYTAQFNSYIRSYTISFNVNGVVTNKTYEYGQTPSYDGTPSKPSDAQYTYYFTGWDKPLATVTGDTVYTAQFGTSINMYTITWNVDGTITQQSYQYGVTPIFDGSIAKESDNYFNYIFIGWDHPVSAVTGDDTYVAVYSHTDRQYAINWYNYNGDLLTTTYQTYDSQIVYNGPIPTKEEDAQYTYSFAGWGKVLGKVTGDTSFTAQFSENLRSYTIIFMNEGNIIQESIVPYGEIPEYIGVTPIKESTVSQTFTFAGWDHVISAVTGDATYIATFSSSVRKYTVTWQNYDGTEIKSEQYDYDALPSYSGTTPTRSSSVSTNYTFIGWSPVISNVTGDATYVAQYSTSIRQYTVTWVDYDNSALAVEVYDYGSTPIYKGATPTRATTDYYVYTFEGWDKEVSTVIGDVTYTATYSSVDNSFLSFSYDDLTMTAVVTGVDSLAYTEIDIPSTFRGYEVVGIGDEAFKDCSDLITLNIPDSIVSIGDRAFEGCSSLQMTYLPESIVSIGDCVFKDCDSLTQFTVLGNLTYIGLGAFNTATNLVDVNVSIDNPNYRSDNGVVYSKDNTNLIYCPHNKYINFTIPNTVTSIWDYAFYYCDTITVITAPDSVSYIGSFAFKNCSALTEFSIPSSVNEINESTFENCDELATINFDTAQLISIGDSAFAYCRHLPTLISLNNGLETIGKHAFEGCSSILIFIMPNSVTSIGEYAFADCSTLVLFSLSNAITRIESHTFYNDVSLGGIALPNTMSYIGPFAFGNCSELHHIFLGTVSSTYVNSYYGCNNLVIIRYYSGTYDIYSDEDNTPITMVGGYSLSTYKYTEFYGVEYQYFESSQTATVVKIREGTDVNIIPSFGVNSTTYTVDKIGPRALNQKSEVNSIHIPSSVKRIERKAFEDSSALTNVYFSEGLEFIGSNSFKQTSLTEVVIPHSVTALESYAFKSCIKLITAKVLANITSFGQVFYDCMYLETVAIPNTVTEISSQAFYYCTRIKDVTLPKKVKVNGSCFYSTLSNLTIYYYGADESDWNKYVDLGQYNQIIANSTRYYYSETFLTGYWHLNAQGSPELY